MNIYKKLFLIILLTVTSSGIAFAQNSKTIDLWPQGAPNENGNPADTARISVFFPRHSIGRTILICPGGGYGGLAMKHEGYDWVPYFNNMGITVAVIKYRMPRGNKEVPSTDAEEALRLLRQKAGAWRINPNDIGIMGFSAGGHLASTVATHAKGDAKPNFQILFYPVITMDPAYTHMGSHDNLLGKKPGEWQEGNYSSEKNVKDDTPRAFIVLSDDDEVVPPENGVNYYVELYKHKVPATLYVYPTGGHGDGMNSTFAYHVEMLNNLRVWLQSF